jgi:D-alanine transaminase
MPIAEAKVSAMDRGFLFGDGAYEVIPVYSRRPFRLAEHLAPAAPDPRRHPPRQSARTTAEWARLIGEIVARNAGEDQSVYLQITRGADTKRNHAFPATGDADRVHHVRTAGHPAAGAARAGHRDDVRADIRWLRCDLKTDLAAGQLPAAPAGGRCRLRRDHPVPRRLHDRGRRLQHLRRQGTACCWRRRRTI